MFAPRRVIAVTIVSTLVSAAPLLAQTPSRKVPIQEDIRRSESVDRRIEGRIDDPLAGGRTGPTVPLSGPSGVVGMDGPPDIPGTTVNSYAPLPPGAPGNEIR